MSWINQIRQWIRSLGRASTLQRGLEEEMRFHIDQQTEKNLRAGMALDEARRQALIKFGGLESFKESTRDEFRPVLHLGDMLRDLRFGARSLRRAPRFTVVASLTLALGIGASTAVFSVVNGVVLKPLPYPDPAALVGCRETISATQFFTYRDENRTFESFGVWSTGAAIVTGLGQPEEVQTVRVTFGALQSLGVPPLIGQWFSRRDDMAGSPESVMLSNGYWLRRYGGDPSVIGKTLTVDSRPRTVVGIMPSGFRFLNKTPDLFLPFHFDRSGLVLGSFNYFALGRLKPGVTLSQANADLARMLPIWLEAWPAPSGFDKKNFERSRMLPELRPLKEELVGDVDNVLWLLMGSIAILLLIACANVAGLLLVRAESRQQELAVRAALGAGWRRIARESLLENLLLGLLGGALGLLFAFAALRLLVTLGPENLPRLSEIKIDPVALLFVLVVSLASGVLVGLVPVLKRAGSEMEQALRGAGRTASESRERHRTQNTLVVVQVALALVLLAGGGLMIRTFLALRSVEPGFTSPDQVQLVRIKIPETLVADAEKVFRMQVDIRDRIAAIPGVSAAAFASAAPMEPFVSANAIFAENQTHAEGDVPPPRRFKFVSPGFFQTVGVPLIAGRDFTWADLSQRRPVVAISENMAREMWRYPAAALGRRIRENPAGPWREIIGVVANVFDDGVHVEAPAMVYWPARMENFEGDDTRVRRSMTFVMRSGRTGSEGLLKDIQHAVWAVNSSLPVAQAQTLQTVYEKWLGPTSFILVMLAIAAGMALLLGLVGIYGVIAYTVEQRRREIGIRLALGAQPVELKRVFIREGVSLALVGVACGLGAAVGVTRLMSSLLFGTSPLDWLTYLLVSLTLIVAAAIASYGPAHRATTINPVEALRI